MREWLEIAKELRKWAKIQKLQGSVNHANVNLAKTHDEDIDNFQVVDSPYALDDLAAKILDPNMMSGWIFSSWLTFWFMNINSCYWNHKALGTTKNIGSKTIIKRVGGKPTLLLAKDIFCLTLMNQ